MQKKLTSSTALLIIDMINAMDFPEGKKLLHYAIPAAHNILKLKKRLKKKKIPVIYVNDNFGEWLSSWEKVFEACSHPDKLGSEVSQMLKPDNDDYFILKPKHSGFFSSSLDNLLFELKIKKLIITGMAGNICVLFTANDAYMRGYQVHVPGDCVASNKKSDNDYTLGQLKNVFKISTAHSDVIR